MQFICKISYFFNFSILNCLLGFRNKIVDFYHIPVILVFFCAFRLRRRSFKHKFRLEFSGKIIFRPIGYIIEGSAIIILIFYEIGIISFSFLKFFKQSFRLRRGFGLFCLIKLCAQVIHFRFKLRFYRRCVDYSPQFLIASDLAHYDVLVILISFRLFFSQNIYNFIFIIKS